MAPVQADAGGFLAGAAVVAGKALLEDPGQVLLPDADTIVRDDQGLPVPVNADGTTGGCIFQGIG